MGSNNQVSQSNPNALLLQRKEEEVDIDRRLNHIESQEKEISDYKNELEEKEEELKRKEMELINQSNVAQDIQMREEECEQKEKDLQEELEKLELKEDDLNMKEAEFVLKVRDWESKGQISNEVNDDLERRKKALDDRESELETKLTVV